MSIPLTLIGIVASAQHSQLLLRGYKSLFLKELQYNERILFLKKVNYTHSELPEIYEFDLVPSDSCFIKRTSFQLSNDSMDYFTKEQFSKAQSRIDQSATIPYFRSKDAWENGELPLAQEAEEPKFGYIPSWVWENPRLINLCFSSKENLLSYYMSKDADAYSDDHDVQYYWSNYGNSIYRSFKNGYYNLLFSRADYTMNSVGMFEVLHNLLEGCYSGIEEDKLMCKYFARLPYEWENMYGLPSKGFKDEYKNTSSSYGRICQKLYANVALFSGNEGLELNHREIFSKSDSRNFIVLLGNSSLKYNSGENVPVNEAYCIAYLQMDNRDSLTRESFYQLPVDMALRSINGKYFPILSDDLKLKYPKYSLVMYFFLYWDALNTATIDDDGTMLIFGHKGELSESLGGNSNNSSVNIKLAEPTPKAGLFRIPLNGISTFIPNDDLFDTGVLRDSTVSMIQSKNGAHWLIGYSKKDNKTTRTLLVQETNTSPFKVYCSLPKDFEPLYMSEISENVIAITGEQIGNDNNSSFIPTKTKVNSVLLVNQKETNSKRILKRGKVTYVDLTSGHVLFSDSKTQANYIFPIKVNNITASDFEGKLLVEGKEVSFKKRDGYVELDGDGIRCRESSLEDVLTVVIKQYFLKK